MAPEVKFRVYNLVCVQPTRILIFFNRLIENELRDTFSITLCIDSAKRCTSVGLWEMMLPIPFHFSSRVAVDTVDRYGVPTS